MTATDLPPPVMTKAEITSFLATEFPQAVGYRVGGVTAEGVDLILDPDLSHLRPGATISGPALFALADVGFYLAVLSRIGPVALAVTTNATIDFLRKPPAEQPLVAQSRLLKLGKRLAVGDVMIRAESGGPVLARAGMTYAIPPGSISPVRE